jgi:hypothetical protein
VVVLGGTLYERFTNSTVISGTEGLGIVCAFVNVPKEWIFYSLPKPVQILSNPDDETAIMVLKEGKSIPIASDPASIIHSLYNSCFLYARIYTEESREADLLKGIKGWLGV